MYIRSPTTTAVTIFMDKHNNVILCRRRGRPVKNTHRTSSKVYEMLENNVLYTIYIYIYSRVAYV